jgi:hypothetical protein
MLDIIDTQYHSISIFDILLDILHTFLIILIVTGIDKSWTQLNTNIIHNEYRIIITFNLIVIVFIFEEIDEIMLFIKISTMFW